MVAMDMSIKLFRGQKSKAVPIEFFKELHCKIFDLIIKMEFFYKLIGSLAVILNKNSL